MSTTFQLSDIDKLYHDYLEIRELEIIYHKVKAVLDGVIKHEEVRNALSSEWLIFGDEVLPRRYFFIHITREIIYG